VLVRAQDDVDPSGYRTAVREQVRAVAGARTGGSITQRAIIADAVTLVLRVVLALLAAAVVIAIVGIANTLALSVLERGRELAVQRALGMTRRQLRSSLTAEALLLAVVGAVLGIVLGIAYGWAGARSLFGAALDGGVPLVVPWDRVVAMALLAALAGALASVLPGRRAARSSPVAALASE
jgi:putative ABC transport system permease protein